MKVLFAILLLFFIASPSLVKINAANDLCFNVFQYGAKGDGVADDSNAFLKAWQDVCAAEDTPTLFIPDGSTFMLQPVSFSGPCKSATVNVVLEGTLLAPGSVENWDWTTSRNTEAWIQFRHINGLVVYGGGTIDGQGAPWWIKYGKNDQDRPRALQFSGCDNLQLAGLTHVNSPKNHISIDSCNGVAVSDLYITAPESSPNTDGIDIASSSNVFIDRLKIATGDDCIAINSGSKFINISDISCGPGHGISIGSLGKHGEFGSVEEIYVKRCTFQGTTNGVRIKTCPGGTGYAKKITYEDINIVGGYNPVIIDQAYEGSIDDLKRESLKVSDVTLRNIRGTTNDKESITLNCASVGCTNIVLEDININSVNGESSASCINVQGTCNSCNPTVSCLN
ncbi:probable polygalacturonase At3g15720 [Cicer arietinum]|uniref:Probable polygalacturonase At3g15720 n=1 Tax=Cicer arietinum TaxID=3827 RepID=A0A1S2YCK9_CICAR|nr:probable polygalacturonase At3g15720 [Cicer arietinum]XP_004502363.1 probable polygalacturonase At3g15720 [Cicer arietinum]